MDFLTDWLTNWLKELLIGGIMGNLEGLFDTVNTQVGEIAAQVGTTPAAWHAGVFSLIRQLSETVILPIAGMVLTFVATYELIQMLLEKNNMHEVDVANLYKWMFKTACAILILSNTFNIVMAVFDVSQSVIAQAGGLIQGSTDVSADMLAELETSLEAMDLGPLLGLWLQSALIGFTMKAMGIIIFVLVYGRMLEIYLLTSLAPIPVATLSNRELGSTGQNYIKSLFAVGFQGLLILVCVAIYAVLIQGMQSCSSTMLMLGNAGAGALGASTYPCEDRDMLAAEAAYCALEDDLQHYLDTYESTHDYDEYHFDLDEIEHDPYVLLSLLCALHEGQWTIDEVQGTLQMLFDRQYILTEDVVVETRYRTETDTWTDEDGNSHTDTYQVPYDYYICTVTLENFDLSHVPVYVMGEDQLSRYAIYMATLGNRPDLFPDSPYVNKYITGKPGDYEVPGEYLDDETFAAMLAEAQKYIGYPYVWGGSSPATSFDCSGYVSWVINHSGWNVGRLGAQGLYNICTPTSSPKPGDLVFFKGTYDTPGVSHCGIYVGDGKMLHCGDPIGYANLNTSYWQSHFYAYGRLP